jgi:alpha-beta hydrolase superfamily lysophospholipase
MQKERNMNQESHELIASDGLKLFAQSWSTEKKPKVLVVIVHGLGEHSGRYAHVAKVFNENGIQVFSFDQRGHGKSEGPRGHTPSGEQLMYDVVKAINVAKETFEPDLPVFLYGHSLGALEVLYFGATIQENLKGIIATSPPLDLSSTPKSKITLAKLMNPLLPKLTMPNGLDTNALSHDTSVVDAYKADPFVHDQISVRLGYFMITGAEKIMAAASAWHYPLLLMHGSDDRICGVKGTEELVKILTGDITYKRWEGLYHETHNEPQKNEVIQVMVNWIKARL